MELNYFSIKHISVFIHKKAETPIDFWVLDIHLLVLYTGTIKKAQDYWKLEIWSVLQTVWVGRVQCLHSAQNSQDKQGCFDCLYRIGHQLIFQSRDGEIYSLGKELSLDESMTL